MANGGKRFSVWRKRVFWVVVLLLVVAQQYPGFWKSEVLVLGFLPVPLFYQVVVSLLAVVVWWAGTVVAWPVDPEAGELESEAIGEGSPVEDPS